MPCAPACGRRAAAAGSPIHACSPRSRRRATSAPSSAAPAWRRRRARGAPLDPDPGRRWLDIVLDDDAGTITRPPGLRLDLGGSGKGHVADLVARHFAALREWVVDCGGDIRAGGAREIQIAHPLLPYPAATLCVRDGAVASSSVVARAWLRSDGRRAHHLLDPATGEPAWSGLLSATALAPTTLEAETLAKVALLRGAAGARDVLSRHGGVIVHDGGDVERVGTLS